MMIHFVRKHTAAPGVTVTESKELPDARPGISPREVDVVVEGNFDGDPVVTSVEVIEHSRPASITWAEQQIAKHRFLPSTQLILVSKSGYSKNALTAVKAEGGWVKALQPRIIEIDGKPGTRSLFANHVKLTPLGCLMTVQRPDGIATTGVQKDTIIFDCEGLPRGFALELAEEALNLRQVIQKLSREAPEHPERDELKSFTCEMLVGELGYCLQWEETGELHALQTMLIEGTFSFLQSELPFMATELGERRYEAGQGLLFGRPGVWVATTDENMGVTTLSWRMVDDKPLFDALPIATHKFPELAEVIPPPGWVEVETPSGT